MADRFCSQCGAELIAGARFCITCGRPLKGGVRLVGGAAPRIGRWAPLAVFGVVLVVGTAVVLAGRSNPVPPPAIPGGGAPPPAAGKAPPFAGGQGAAQMPQGHPAIEIPEDVVKAIAEMKKTADAAPQDVEQWTRLAGVQYRAGMVDEKYLPEAAKSYEHVLEIDPQNLEALRHLGNIAFDQQLPVRAIDYYLRYLTLKPDDFSVTTDMATMYLSRGDANTAIQFYQKVLKEKPDFFEALFNLGIAYRSSGDTAQATSYFLKAKAAAPDDRARQQVEQMMASGGVPGEGAPPGAPPAANPPAVAGGAAPGGLRGGVEAIFRKHPMLGPKIESIDWEGDGKARVMINEFPMQQMPPEMRQRFLDKIRAQIRDQKAAAQMTAQLTIELVDPATQTVMETVVE